MPTPIPAREELRIKEEFSKRYKQIMGEQYDLFMDYSTSFIRRSIRVNTLKIDVEKLKARLEPNWKLTPIPWCKEGFWIKGERLDIGNLSEHILGYIYVQEAASMIPPIALDPKPGDTVLDLCAAPGSKTTQMAAMMKNTGVIVANDLSAERIKALGINLNRSGVINAIITHSEGRQMKGVEYDKILVDAPCSATGTIRKNLKVLGQYNYTIVERLAAMQRGLIKKAYGMLKPGGTMVYSTCTMEPAENEGTVTYLLENEPTASVEKIEMDIKRSEPFLEFEGNKFSEQVRNCIRISPQDNDSEGFFIARIKKAEL